MREVDIPTYTNSNETTVYSGEPYIKFEPGETITAQYSKGLPSGVTLTDHEPTVSPWVLLASVTSVPMEAPVDVYAYDNIMVYNASDNAVTIAANEDDSNAYPVMQASKETYSNQDRVFGCVEVLTMGTGTVYIYGVK